MNDTSRAQGWAICAGAGIAAFLFLLGILSNSYWAIAIPVAIITFFALGLVAWVGYTIATIQIDADALHEDSDAATPAADTSSGSGANPSATEDAA